MDPDPLSCILLSISSVVQTVAPAISINTPTLSSIIALLCAICALLISAFASSSEIAFFSLSNRQHVEILENQSDSPLQHLITIPEKVLATILITNNLVNVTIVILCNYAMNQILTFSNGILSFVFQSIVLTFLILLFGEILPKLYATSHNLHLAYMSSKPLNFLVKLFHPLSRLMVKSTFIVNKIVTTHGDEISKEDLSHALEITHVKTGEEKDLLEGILKFGGTTVTEIMRPRVDIVDIDIADNFEKVISIVLEAGYSRMPVFEENPDNIKGILYAKDLLSYIGREKKDFKWQSLIREAYFVPETRMIDDLLEDFRTKKIHMAVVVDEFGGTQGLVTLEDVLEEIVGDINDEYDTEEKFYQKLPDGTYIFEGKTLLNDFFKVTEIDEKDFGDYVNEVETIAGLLLEVVGDFPKLKEPIIFGNCQFTVVKIDKHRIVSVIVKLLPNQDEEQ